MEFSFSIYLIVFILLFYFTTIKIDTQKIISLPEI